MGLVQLFGVRMWGAVYGGAGCPPGGMVRFAPSGALATSLEGIGCFYRDNMEAH